MAEAHQDTLRALRFWQSILHQSQAQDLPELSARQKVILLHIYLEPAPHSVTSLAQQLHIPKAAMSRAVESLCNEELIRRKRDETDKRLVILQRTIKGSVYLSDMAELLLSELDKIEPTQKLENV